MTPFWRLQRGGSSGHEIAPEDIFLDSTNLPGRDEGQFEGRVVRSVSRKGLFAVGLVFALVFVVFAGQAFYLQILQGEAYADISRNNRLDRYIVFATRGLILDRTGRELAWNEALFASSTAAEAELKNASTYTIRHYNNLPGLSHILGYVQYPKADSKGVWWREEYSGVTGVESSLNEVLGGTNGNTMVETDAYGDVQRADIIAPAKNGQNVTLSIDASVQSKLYSILSKHAEAQGFVGGAAVIMDIHTGELLALTSFPEYDNEAFANGDSSKIASANTDSRTPLLDRAVSGLYAPGSIVKPIFAAAALAEKLISPDKEILSTGKITIPNPYNPDQPSIFRDWTVHGLVDMRTAIAVSSDEYFYTIGGGYESQPGLGIAKLDEYATRFGLGIPTGVPLPGEQEGVIPTPKWKEQVFGADDPWRIGDTYHTVIGQYGFQVTPIQAVRFTAAIANGGKLLTPHILASSTPEYQEVGILNDDLEIVREGMRLAVTSSRSDATVKSLNMSGISIAAKTGTAEIGSRNQWMNSWSVGYWPSDNPRYAYAVVLEHAPAGTLSGAAPGLRPFFEWLAVEKPEYVK